MVNVLFAHDTEVALAAAAALVNTASSDGEALPDIAALKRFLRAYNWIGRHDGSQDELRAVQELRPRLRRIWYEDESGVAETINRLLRESGALPQLVRHGTEPYHLHATPPDAPLATRMSVEAAMAFADLVRGGELSRLRTCELADCDHVLVDLSRNRSKRFCEGGCGNRAAVAAYRARKAGRT